ncbi:MAG: hypothetical protein NVS9B7_23500 [Flavisolibacter sp.]
MQQIIQAAFPYLKGVDAHWEGSIEQRPLIKNGPTPYELVNSIFPYYCDKETGKIERLKETGTFIWLSANEFGWIMMELPNISFENYPLYLLPKQTGALKGYPVFKEEAHQGSSFTNKNAGYERTIAIFRKGDVPYDPVTKKQFLESFISFQELARSRACKEAVAKESSEANNINKRSQSLQELKLYYANRHDTTAATRELLKKMEENNLYFSKLEREENAKQPSLENLVVKQYDAILQPAKDALENLGNDANQPAYLKENYTEQFVGFSGPGEGKMVIKINPVYFKKSIGNFSPQIIVIRYEWDGYRQTTYWKDQFEKNIDLSSLEAMLDK